MLVVDVRLVIAIGEPLKVIPTLEDVIPDPAATLKETGFGLAARPNPVPPVPTFRLTGKVIVPAVVLTRTVPV